MGYVESETEDYRSVKYEDTFKAAAARREVLGNEISVRRLIDGTGDDFPGLYLDCLGSVAIAHIHTDHQPSAYREMLSNQALFAPLGIESLFLRQRYSDASKSAENESELLWGKDIETALIDEHEVCYQVYPKRYVNAGFFVDMRDVRQTLSKCCQGKRVLNLFCYTGSLGVSAAVGGASQTVQVDINKGVLGLARENQRLNQNKIAGEIRYIPEDSFVFLEKESRRIERGASPYDIVIVDPPSFSRSKQGTFQIARDIKALVEGILAVSAPTVTIFATTNLASLTPEDIFKAIHDVCDSQLRQIVNHSALLPPPDFNAPLRLSIASRGVSVEIAQ